LKIVPVLLKYAYGKKILGESLENKAIYPALLKVSDDVHPFWYDDFLNDKKTLQEKLIEFVNNIKPDIVFFILMRDEFTFSTFEYLKKNYITINWFCDDQWRFESYSKYYAPHFSHVITTDKFAVDKYLRIGYRNVILSQWASFGYIDKLDFNSIEYEYDISFVGAKSGYRKWLCDYLIRSGRNVVCFGAGWDKGVVSYDEMQEIFKKSKINLNIPNSVSYDIRYLFSSFRSAFEFLRSCKRVEQIKARNFEIPAFGGFQLTNYVPSIEDFFTIGEEIAIYSSPDDLLQQIVYYLENENERKKIMINGYNKMMQAPTYTERFKEIFFKMGFLL
jgi:spore maturation protein CgeB